MNTLTKTERNIFLLWTRTRWTEITPLRYDTRYRKWFLRSFVIRYGHFVLNGNEPTEKVSYFRMTIDHLITRSANWLLTLTLLYFNVCVGFYDSVILRKMKLLCYVWHMHIARRVNSICAKARYVIHQWFRWIVVIYSTN